MEKCVHCYIVLLSIQCLCSCTLIVIVVLSRLWSYVVSFDHGCNPPVSLLRASSGQPHLSTPGPLPSGPSSLSGEPAVQRGHDPRWTPKCSEQSPRTRK